DHDALHVHTAGPEASKAVAPSSLSFQRADGMHGIEVTRDQDAGLALFGMWKAGADAAAKTLAPGDALDGRAHDRHLARGEIEHAIDSSGIPGRAFAFDPVAQTQQHGLGIEGKIGRIHRKALTSECRQWCSRAPRARRLRE